MKKISRRSFLAVCGAMAATAALTACGGSSASTAGTAASGSTAGSTAGSAASGEVFELKLSTTQTDTSMIYQGLQAAADKVAEDTDGHVKVTIYPSSQLGGEEDMIDQALQGMGIAVLTDAGRLSSYVNDIGIMNMAYIVDNYEDGMKLMATDTFKGWDADLANNGICGLCYNYYDGARSFMGHKAYKTPADLKGAVIRTPGADPYVESISAMGATPYNIAWSEVYNGIQTKSIDGCEVQYTSAVSSKIYEVCEYVSKTEHINLFNMVICGQAWFDKLPAEYQEVMKKDFSDCAYNNAQDIIAAQADMEKTLTDNGMTIVEVDKDIFREAVKPAYEKLGWTELREQLYKEAGVEELIALILVAGIAVLVFVSALMRTIGHPLNWAQDVALIAFAWLIFLGSDVAMRGSGLIGVDLFVKKFPAGVQKVLDILFKVIIAAFLCVLIYYGYGMTTTGWARQITSLHISYSWVTMAVPVGSFFMLISTILNIIERVKTPAGQEVKHEAGRDVG